MDVVLRGLFYSFAIVLIAAAGSFADNPPTKVPVDKKAAEYTHPKSTYRTYIEAVRRNDAKAAKKCWTIDDENKSGALDVIVGLWISTRQLNQLAMKKFGEDGERAIPKGWRRDDITDKALDLTKKRLGDAEVKITGWTAELKIKWKDDDGVPNPAFEFNESPISFRKVHGDWKIDANEWTGLKRGEDFFEKGTWGPMFRDQVLIMNEAVAGMEKGRLNNAKELKEFINRKFEVMKKKYEEEEKTDRKSK
jgi:hypothetical protein